MLDIAGGIIIAATVLLVSTLSIQIVLNINRLGSGWIVGAAYAALLAVAAFVYWIIFVRTGVCDWLVLFRGSCATN
jgi:hypothetical protein